MPGDPARLLTELLGIPTLYYHPNATSTPIEVNPGMFSTYYENIDSAEIPFPTNFFAIAGNASAKSQADVDERTTGLTWWCENGPEDRRGRDRALMPRVTCSGNIQVILRFPDCVDTSAVPPAGTNQRWKVAYAAANGGRCPAGMKRIPQLRFSVRYNVRGLIRNGWNGVPPLKLSCSDTMGDGYCFHGDFINGWFDDAQVNLLAAKSRTKWSSIDGARGTGKAGNGGCKPVDRDPTGGTSDYAKSLVMMGKSM